MLKQEPNINSKLYYYLNEPKYAKQLSFNLQREEIERKFPNGYFPKEKESLEEYIFYLIHRFPLRMLKNHYIENSIHYMLKHEPLNLFSVTKELYPTIGKKQGKSFTVVEGGIRNSILKNYLMIPENTREEIFPIAKDRIPTNFFFLYYLAEYIKTHYYASLDVKLTNIEKQAFLDNIDGKNNALEIIKEEELRKWITKFLYTKLGQFRFVASKSQLLLVDIMLFFIKNKFITMQQLLNDKELCEKWDFLDEEDFNKRINTISFGIANAYQFIEENTYYEIFGDKDLHRALGEYVKNVSNYLKEQDYVRKLIK